MQVETRGLEANLGSSVPVFGHADNAVFSGNDDRRAHHILESLDFGQQTWLPSLRLGLNFGRHGLDSVCVSSSTGEHNPVRSRS